MTLVSEIIRQALRETNVVGINQDTTTSEVSEALARLQAIVLSAVGNEVGYVMEDWTVLSPTSIIKPSSIPLTADQAADFTVPPNARLVCGVTAPTTLKLDPYPQDGQRFSLIDANYAFATYGVTINPNGRRINGLPIPVTFTVGGEVTQWLYRADIASWVQIDPLALEDLMPFPGDFDDYFIIMLAMRLNPRYGQELSESSAARLEQQRAQLTARYTQTRLQSPTKE